MLSLRERIIAKSDRRTKQVYVDSWGETVTVQSLTSEQVERWYQIVDNYKENGVSPPGGRRASVVFMGTIDDIGKDLFRAEDIPLLGEKHVSAITVIFDAIMEISGLTDEAKKDIEKKPKQNMSSSPTSLRIVSDEPTSTDSNES